MEFIEGVALSRLCDYSFGDQSGQWGNIYTSFMKEANLLNLEFIDKVFEIKKQRNYMSLFIDNIRLYKRDIECVKKEDLDYVNFLMSKNDLLELCSNIKDMNFIIFTNLEDTPIDNYIFDKIPPNVLSINAVNAISHGGKVNPIPYGVQRRLTEYDNRIDILKEKMSENVSPTHLLYVNHSENTNKERLGIVEKFIHYDWAIVDKNRISYSDYLEKINQSKFMICPIGNAIDCHRNWEVLYMRRVPIMKKNDYLEYLMKDYPVLFVDDYSDITEDILISNQHLFDKMQNINLENLNVRNLYNNILGNMI